MVFPAVNGAKTCYSNPLDHLDRVKKHRIPQIRLACEQYFIVIQMTFIYDGFDR